MIFLFLTLGIAGLVAGCGAAAVIVGLRRFTAGSSIASALAVGRAYNERGIAVILNYAAESAITEDDAKNASEKIQEMLVEMRTQEIRGDIAVKPSSLAANRWDAAAQNRLYLRLANLARLAAESKRVLWIDSEHAASHAWVLPVQRKLLGTWKRKKISPVASKVVCSPRFSNIGIVLQAYRKSASMVAGDLFRWHRDGARFYVRLCRGAYPREAEFDRTETATRFIQLFKRLRRGGIPTIAATHTLVWSVLGRGENPCVHMLHGRREIHTILLPLVAEGHVRDPAVYVIFGPFTARLKYLWRRFWEDPRLIVWLWT